MPFVPVPNAAQVQAVYQLDGQIVENVNFFAQDATPDLASLTALVNAWNTALKTSIIPLISTSISLLRVIGTLIDVADGLSFISVAGLPQAGGVSGDYLPSNVALTMSLRTGHTGRSFRGRNFLPGIPRSQANGNTFEASFVTNVTNAYADLFSAAAAVEWHPIVASRYSGFTIVGGKKVPTPRTVGIATPINSWFAVDNKVDSQRRRLPGRGR